MMTSKNCFETFTKSEQYPIFVKIHKLIFPETIDDSINTVPIDLICGESEKAEKILVFVKKEEQKNEQASE